MIFGMAAISSQLADALYQFDILDENCFLTFCTFFFNNNKKNLYDLWYLHINSIRSREEGSEWTKIRARIVAGGIVVEEVTFPFTACQSIMAQSTTVGADRQH